MTKEAIILVILAFMTGALIGAYVINSLNRPELVQLMKDKKTLEEEKITYEKEILTLENAYLVMEERAKAHSNTITSLTKELNRTKDKIKNHVPITPNLTNDEKRSWLVDRYAQRTE